MNTDVDRRLRIVRPATWAWSSSIWAVAPVATRSSPSAMGARVIALDYSFDELALGSAISCGPCGTPARCRGQREALRLSGAMHCSTE
jgi:hypothetical protein